MSLSGIMPPTKKEVKITPAGCDVVHSVAEVQGRGLTNLPESERKKIEEEIANDKKKVIPLMTEDYPFSIGGYGHWTEKNVNPRALWTPKERKAYRDFIQLWKKYQAEKIPVLKEELRWKLMNRYGTTYPHEYEKNLNIQMMKDPRLMIKVRRGVVKTSVKAQHERNARSLEGGVK